MVYKNKQLLVLMSKYFLDFIIQFNNFIELYNEIHLP